MPEGLCYVTRRESYHKGGLLWDHKIRSAELYPAPVAQKIAQIHRAEVVNALQHIQDLIREHQEIINMLHGLAVEIRTGARTYMRIPDQLVSFYDLREEVLAMPESALKTYLLRELEAHERELSCGSQGEGPASAHV